MGRPRRGLKVSSVQRRYPGRRTPTSRPMRHHTRDTLIMPLGCQSKDLLTSYLVTFDAFSRPCFHLLAIPILGRAPLDSDICGLSHKRQQNRMSGDAPYPGKPEHAVFYWLSALPSEQGMHVAQRNCSRAASSRCHRCLRAGRRARCLRAPGQKSPRGNNPWGDESPSAARLHWHTREASSAGDSKGELPGPVEANSSGAGATCQKSYNRSK